MIQYLLQEGNHWVLLRDESSWLGLRHVTLTEFLVNMAGL